MMTEDAISEPHLDDVPGTESTHIRVALDEHKRIVQESRRLGMSIPNLLGSMLRLWEAADERERKAAMHRLAADRLHPTPATGGT